MPNLNPLLVPVALVTALVTALSAAATTPKHHAARRANSVTANENRVASGTMRGDTLQLALEVREGDWHPYGPTGPAVRTLAFGEAGKGLLTPGPMIRVRALTHVHVSVRNTASALLVVHGLTAHRSPMADTLAVPPGETRDITFTADDEGTFFYWATTTGADFSGRKFEDAQLNGALIVDPRTGTSQPDRVFVVQRLLPRNLPPKTGADLINGFFTFNGMPWPGTERLHYAQGDSVRWRVINATSDIHPLHLHGFYFRVTARGDVNRDTLYWPAQERMAVTELLDEGTTMNLAWYADRPGAWVFHCHLNWHVVPNPALGDARKSDSLRLRELFAVPDMSEMQAMDGMQGMQGMPATRKSQAMANHSETGMGGLLLRMDIKPAANWRPYAGPRERLHLYVQSDSQPGDSARRFGYALAHGNELPSPTAIQWPGPPIILHKGQPTSIVVINRALEPSQVHWHGLELDSYYDGVAGLSSNADMVSPMIMPRDSFEMTVTPPRSGSFMYHTHVNDMRQQSHGLYGPIIVLPAGQAWDPESDLIFQTGSNPNDESILNGSAKPPALTLHVGKAYRVRLMNVSLDEWFNDLRLTAADGSMPLWTSLATDGFDLPAWQQLESRARTRVTIGETRDFRITFKTPGELAMVGSSDDGSEYARQVIHVVP
jgi:FtsP/CotA-like multicopper oxidase with cupredoxin domain